MIGAVALGLAALLPSRAAAAGADVPLESFAAQQTFDDPRISSEGTYVAVTADLGDEYHGIMVYRLSDMSQTVFMKLPRYELPLEVHWVSDTRLVYVKGGKHGALEQPYDQGEIIAMDYDGKHHTYIYGWKESTLSMGLPPGHGNFAGLPAKPNGKFYMTRTTTESAIGRSQLYEVDATSGRSRLVADVGGDQNLTFVMDPAGVPRYAYGADKNELQLLYVADAQGENWRKIAGENIGGVFVPVGLSADGKHVFGRYAVGGGPAALVKADLDLGHREVLASDPFNDVGKIIWDSRLQPLAVEFKGDQPKVQLLDPSSPDAKLYNELRGGFPGQHVSFVDHSADGKVSLIYISSDRNPGEWAVMNRKTDTLARLLQRNAAIDPGLMGSRHYVRFKASDGLELDAYVTVPKGVTELKSLPMVLVPHGGPHYVSDDWGFDSDAQFLASRGYLVLQVNYRGSSGRGYSFQEAGYQQWGKRIQQDLVDGMRWAVAKGYADPRRICVYGASFGGYSALMLAATAPDLVHCAAGLSGLYDLRAMAEKSDTSRSFRGRAYIARVVGRDDDEMLANSPLSRAADIRVPVFLAHGEEDERTPFGQAQAMRKALERAGNKPQWMAVEGEGHGFYVQAHKIEFYRQLEAFLGSQIGAAQ
ncbi:MAG TPA: prolyl oligopeptidase family serine peptidase [Thermomonas sp.]|nr:prolyl oligopeptidase family serine peptidase [Thermomonas sp.]